MLGFAVLVWVAYLDFSESDSRPRPFSVGGSFRLIDRKGEFAGFFEEDVDPAALARRISAIMARGAT